VSDQTMERIHTDRGLDKGMDIWGQQQLTHMHKIEIISTRMEEHSRALQLKCQVQEDLVHRPAREWLVKLDTEELQVLHLGGIEEDHHLVQGEDMEGRKTMSEGVTDQTMVDTEHQVRITEEMDLTMRL